MGRKLGTLMKGKSHWWWDWCGMENALNGCIMNNVVNRGIYIKLGGKIKARRDLRCGGNPPKIEKWEDSTQSGREDLQAVFNLEHDLGCLELS